MIKGATVVLAILASSVAGWATPASSGNAIQAITATPIVTGLNFPAAFTFNGAGQIYYGERLTGQIHVFDPRTGQDKLLATIPNVAMDGEQGLLGLAFLPGATHFVLFVYATRKINGVPTNQVLRLTTNITPIFSSNTQAMPNHNGGRILFGPDGDLYVVIGDAQNSNNSQDLSRNAGKMLRMTSSGGVPNDNPFPGNPAWSYGHRNSFGFTFDPLTGRLWETENGPECNDEINLIARGANFGWGPHETCLTPPPPPANTNQDGPNPVMPLAWFTPTIAPTGAAFCVGCGLPSSEGTLFFGAYNTHQITQVVLDANRTGIASMAVVYTHPSAILSMERGPDNAIYFSDPSGIYKLVPG
jgi:glucose/arabinose dehydrogenase